MPKIWPARPSADFKITSLKWQVDVEAKHRTAGFEPISYEVLQRRFWQYLTFLQRHGYLLTAVPSTSADLSPDAELRNSDLTDDGYRFVQRTEGKWMDRASKDKGAEAEETFLDKWRAAFLAEALPSK